MAQNRGIGEQFDGGSVAIVRRRMETVTFDRIIGSRLC